MDVLKTDSNALMTAMNAANEQAVYAFLKEKIVFKDIPDVIEEVLGKVEIQDAETIDEAEANIIKYQKAAEEITGRL